jgi:hypothetical protein
MKPERYYESLKDIIETWKRLSNPGRDYRSLKEIVKA